MLSALADRTPCYKDPVGLEAHLHGNDSAPFLLASLTASSNTALPTPFFRYFILTVHALISPRQAFFLFVRLSPDNQSTITVPITSSPNLVTSTSASPSQAKSIVSARNR
ncbi:hypothetical protein KC327_g79 [Hortaea werneckii]|nr:hypothetical protein KC327_g79 [Hortaea werneckii]